MLSKKQSAPASLLSSRNNTQRVRTDCSRAIGFLAGFDQLLGEMQAGLNAIKRTERLRDSVFLDWRDGFKVSADTRKAPKEFARYEGKVAGDHQRPGLRTSCQRRVDAAQRSPLRIDVGCNLYVDWQFEFSRIIAYHTY